MNETRNRVIQVLILHNRKRAGIVRILAIAH